MDEGGEKKQRQPQLRDAEGGGRVEQLIDGSGDAADNRGPGLDRHCGSDRSRSDLAPSRHGDASWRESIERMTSVQQ